MFNVRCTILFTVTLIIPSSQFLYYHCQLGVVYCVSNTQGKLETAQYPIIPIPYCLGLTNIKSPTWEKLTSLSPFTIHHSRSRPFFPLLMNTFMRKLSWKIILWFCEKWLGVLIHLFIWREKMSVEKEMFWIWIWCII